MPPRVAKEYLIQLRDDEHLAGFMNGHPTKLLIVDVFLEWCGPCSLLNPTYKTIAMKIDEWDQRMQFLQADVTRVKSLAQYQQSSKPKFLVFLGPKLLTEISGVNVPAISAAVNRFIPSLEEVFVLRRLASVPKLMIYNLDRSTSKEVMKRELLQGFQVVDISIPKRTVARGDWYAVVTFLSEKERDEAVERLAFASFLGQRISVKKAVEKEDLLEAGFLESHRTTAA